jgi:hypothetical protein
MKIFRTQDPRFEDLRSTVIGASDTVLPGERQAATRHFCALGALTSGHATVTQRGERILEERVRGGEDRARGTSFGHRLQEDAPRPPVARIDTFIDCTR